MKTSIARIYVERPFCFDCSISIKKKINEASSIQHLKLQHEASLVAFYYSHVNQVSTVLNTLTALGHPEIGEHKNEHSFEPFCQCQMVEQAESTVNS